MKRKYLNKIGKQGKINISANRKIYKMWHDYGIESCEVMVSDFCTRMWGLTNAHRHKRWEYIKRPEKLYDYNQVIRACLTCHRLLEVDKELTEAIFLTLRGKDNLK